MRPFIYSAILLFTAINTAHANPIPSTQDPSVAPAYIGEPAIAKPLAKQPTLEPQQVGLHANGGNTKVYDTPGPLGINPQLSSVLSPGLGPFMFDRDGNLNSGCLVPLQDQPGAYLFCIAALDPVTLDVLARWFPPAGQTLNLAYAMQSLDGALLFTSKEGHIYVLERSNNSGTPVFTVIRDIDLVDLGILDGTLPLLAASFDADGNIWFTTGGIVGIGDDPGTSTTLGYVTPDGIPYSIDLPDEIVENGIAVNELGVFISTGPLVADSNNTGRMYRFAASYPGIETVWQEDYDAGSGIKPGGFARGSGATPTLLGRRFVAITDNADDQISVEVYRQRRAFRQLACSIAVFENGASANDIGMIGVRDGLKNSIVVLNDYNAPPVRLPPENSPLQNMNGMSPGVTRIDISATGNRCTTRWSTPIRIKSVPVVSTETGLIYGYTQDSELAEDGQYIWYLVALDYETGEIVWQVRAGAGFTYNDSFRGAALGPDGTLYQGLGYGAVMLRDGQ